MSLASKLNEWSSIFWKLGLGILIFMTISFIAVSIIANVTESNATGGLPNFPAVRKAQYVVLLKTTGETLLTNNYDQCLSPNSLGDKLYVLHGFYQLRDNKWRWYKNDLPLDEYYFGDIKIIRREE